MILTTKQILSSSTECAIPSSYRLCIFHGLEHLVPILIVLFILLKLLLALGEENPAEVGLLFGPIL